MIVRQDHRGRVVADRVPYHFPGMYGCTVDRAEEQVIDSEYAMSVIQKRTAENFAFPFAEMGNKKLFGSRYRGEFLAWLEALRKQLKCKLDNLVFTDGPCETVAAVRFGNLEGK
jgi:hypothetical protein